MTTKIRIHATLLATCVAMAAMPSVFGQSLTTFDGFTAGQSVNGQNGWNATGNWDEEVVDLGGNLAWRVSNASTAGSFGNMPTSAPSGFYSGESGATHVASGNPANTSTFYGSFDFWSVTGAAQDGLRLTISPDDGTGSRQSFIRIEDNGATGFDLVFYDSQDNHPVTNMNGGFHAPVTVATGLSYTDVHNIAFEINFVDGIEIDGGTGLVNGNDIVNIYVNDSLAHSGTTWESYFWTTNEGQTPPSVRAVDQLMFRISGTEAPDLAGGGLYIDNVFTSNAVPEPGTIALAGLAGVAGLAIVRRRRRK